MTRTHDVLTDIPGRPGTFWGDHSTYVGPDRPPAWLSRLLGQRWSWNLIGILVALRLLRRRRHYRAVVTEGGISGQCFAWLQALLPWGRKPHVLVDCNWYLPASKLRRAVQWLRLHLAARSARTFVVWASHEVEDYARAFALPADRFTYVPFHTTLRDYQYEVRNDGYLFAGGNYDRDYPTLIEAVRDLDVPVWIATTKPEQLDGVSLPANVRVEGTSMAAFRQAMAAARVVVVPMQAGLLHSGGQQTCLNAMLMGKPTIAVGRKWAIDFISDGEDGLIVDYEDIDGLRRAVRWVLDHPEAARRMGERAAERAAWFTTKRTMRAVYRLATEEPQRQRDNTKEILIVARWPVGGIRTHLRYNYPALTAAGCRCTVVVPDDESLPTLRETLPDATFVPVPLKGRDCPMWQTLRPLLAERRFDLVHAHGLTAAAHARLACLGRSVPLIVTLHEPLRDVQFRGLAGAGKRWLLGRALAGVSAIVTVSEDSRANLLHHFPNLRRHEKKIHAIPNGIDTAPYRQDDPPTTFLRDELGISDETFLIGFLGRFMPEKGFPHLLEAVDRLRRFGGTPPFHLVAFGSSDYRNEYSRRIEALGLGEHITLRDFVPDVRPVLEQLDLVVVPSLWEASSLVSMEAMCAGVPVLGSDCPGLREVLHNTPSRTVQTGVVAALETGLRQALAAPWFDEAAAFAPLARRRFDNQRSARRLLRLYANFLDDLAIPAAPRQAREPVETALHPLVR